MVTLTKNWNWKLMRGDNSDYQVHQIRGCNVPESMNMKHVSFFFTTSISNTLYSNKYSVFLKYMASWEQ
jgi:hypothetical protein